MTFMLATVSALIGYSILLEDRPQDLPWTELRLDQPIGFFTGRKLAGLDGEYGTCQRLLDQAGVSYRPFPATGANQCRRDQNISLLSSGEGGVQYSPSRLAPSCPVVAALTIWENQVVQPAAIEFFGQKVSQIKHLGSFSCRPIAGTDNWSEHANANAIDIAGFTLADGQEILLINHWESSDAKAQFLKKVRDGSCNLFATVLSPDYNAAHADHFHLDQAKRSRIGYRMCR